jgi:hypothetical protein
VAVYGDTPDFFPPLRTQAEKDARRGLLSVVRAGRSTSVAVAVGEEFGVPQGARGRLVRPGQAERLAVRFEEPVPPAIQALLEGSQLIEIVPPGAAAEAYVGRSRDGDWLIGDDLYSPRDGEGQPLCRVPAADHAALLEGLIHYYRYVRTLRLARRCGQDPGGLVLSLLDCGDEQGLAGTDLQDPDLPEACGSSDGAFRYALREGGRFCVRVANRTPLSLYTTVLNCSASGQVEDLGFAQIGRQRSHVFWLDGVLGSPFAPWLAAAASQSTATGIDRLVAVATNRPGVDLSYLRVEEAIQQVVDGPREGYRSAGQQQGAPCEFWIATIVPVLIER